MTRVNDETRVELSPRAILHYRWWRNRLRKDARDRNITIAMDIQPAIFNAFKEGYMVGLKESANQ